MATHKLGSYVTDGVIAGEVQNVTPSRNVVIRLANGSLRTRPERGLYRCRKPQDDAHIGPAIPASKISDADWKRAVRLTGKPQETLELFMDRLHLTLADVVNALP